MTIKQLLTVLLAAGTLALGGGIYGAAAQPSAASVGRADIANKVVYYPETDTYYELAVTDRDRWAEANATALSKAYKGRRGRLAVIRDGDLYRWLVEQFPRELRKEDGGFIWIGLRYFCSTRELIWADGKKFEKGDFALWDNPWYRMEDIRCGGRSNIPYMPVYISGENDRFRASGPGKGYSNLLVEYPPPKATAKSGEQSEQN